MPNTTEFKIDLLWKVVVLGCFAIAGRLSWHAWVDSQDTLMRVADTMHTIDTRVSVAEWKIESNTSRIRDAETELNTKTKR